MASNGDWHSYTGAPYFSSMASAKLGRLCGHRGVASVDKLADTALQDVIW